MKNRIMDACIVSIGNHGIEKASIQDIANEADIARQTIYKYFENKIEVLTSTFQREGLAFALDVNQHIKGMGIESAFIEAFVYVVMNFEKNPILAQLISRGSTFLNDVGMKHFEFSQLGIIVFSDIFDKNKPLQKQADEISELWTRNALSMIAMPSHKRKTQKELRSYVKRRLIPGLHL